MTAKKQREDRAGSIAAEAARKRQEMLAAARDMDRLRQETRDPGWGGVREIRKWRDAEQRK